jgi:hypothetical protein
MKKSSAVGGLGFACAQHVDQLTAARALLPRDRVAEFDVLTP